MSVPEEQLEQLENEQMLGGRAQHAYDQFIQSFIDKKRMMLYEAFSQLPITAEVELMEVKRMLYAIDALETDILTVIETGELASLSLNKKEKH